MIYQSPGSPARLLNSSRGLARFILPVFNHQPSTLSAIYGSYVIHDAFRWRFSIPPRTFSPDIPILSVSCNPGTSGLFWHSSCDVLKTKLQALALHLNHHG